MNATREVKLKFSGDTTEIEASLARATGLAERFNEALGELPPPSAIEALAFNPDDVLVLRYQDRLTQDQVERIAERMREMFPDNKVMVLDSDADLFVVAPEQEP